MLQALFLSTNRPCLSPLASLASALQLPKEALSSPSASEGEACALLESPVSDQGPDCPRGVGLKPQGWPHPKDLRRGLWWVCPAPTSIL